MSEQKPADTSAAPSERTRAKRIGHLAAYDRGTIERILDASPVCHVAYVLDSAPVVTPTFQWREGNRVYWHGSSASRMLQRIDGAEVCMAVTIIDGLVLARSGFEHTIGYRSAMLFGKAEAITDAAEKERHLEVFMEQMLPGRWAMLRPVKPKELKATAVLSMPIEEASAKISAGMPTDADDDLSWPVWAGVIPVALATGAPVADPRNHPDIEMPDHVRRYRFGAADRS